MFSSLSRRTRARFGIVVVAALALLVGILPSTALALPPGPRADVELIDLPKETEAEDADTGTLDNLAGEGTVETTEYEPAHTTAPAGGDASADLSDPAAGALTQAGDLPVLVGAPEDATATEADGLSGSWAVSLASQEETETAEIEGMLLTVTPPTTATGDVDIALDYSEFEQLYSADWADRLQFVQYPACYLTTPDVDGCDTRTVLATDNDDDSGRVTATVDTATATTAATTATNSAADGGGSVGSAVYRSTGARADALRTLLPAASSGAGSVVLATEDGGSGAKGDYTATPLAGAGTWTAGGSSGAFTWSQSVTSPPVPAGPTPSVAFAYNSQTADGRTSATNNQASWVGDGWDYNPGSIERTYTACSDDAGADDANNAAHKTADLCWGSDNAVLTLGGSTTELVRDDDTGVWTTANGDGSRIDRIKDTDTANGDRDGEHWRVTTRDGTRYYFGLNRLPGWSTGDETTDSVYTVPVAGNNPGEPCYDSSFAASLCTKAWRWNLDYVVDVDGNAMSLWYDKETNYYAKNDKYTEPVSYVRGGHLTRIDYGQRASTLFTADPIARVSFRSAERCFADGELTCSEAAFTSRDPGRYRIWYDTPAELYCSGASGKRCMVASPTFWSRRLLTSVTTWAQRDPATTELTKVDLYDLVQSFPRTKTDTAPPLWLESIRRTGYGTDGETISVNPVEFSENTSAMPNRVVEGAADDRPSFDRLRVARVVTEYGGEIDVTYSTPTGACSTGSGFPAKATNTGRCYPVYWSPDPDEETIDWFNKYVVTKIEQKPRVDGVPDVVTEYQYNKGAWSLNQTEFSKKKTRTYDQWRGYDRVTVLTGQNDTAVGIVRGKTVTDYFRGLDGDPLPDGTVRSEVVNDVKGAEIARDHSAFAGMAAQSRTYTEADNTGAGGTVVSRTVTKPSAHLLATRVRTGIVDLKAYRTQTDETTTITASSGDGDDTRTSRTVRITTEYDDTYGLPVRVESAGDTGADDDETCVVTSYLNNPDTYLIGLVEQTRTTAGTCAEAASATGADVISGTRTAYDDNAYIANYTPTKGRSTAVWNTDGAGTGWTLATRTSYDTYGRVSTVEDAVGNDASTTYNPAEGQVFSTTAENAKHYTSTTEVDPGRGTALKVTDANGGSTVYAYDPLGRATAVWAPSQNPETDAPVRKFTYDTTPDQPVAVTTAALRDDGGYDRSVVIYDGLGRERQSQTPAVGGGRLVTDTLYNAAGTISRTNNGYYAEGDPSAALFEKQSDFDVPNATVTTYDGQGRPLTVTPSYASVAQPDKATTYDYGYDNTTVIAPSGAASTRTWTDALGRAVRVDTFTDAGHVAYTATRYTYDARGNRVSATDDKQNTWTWTYDARGRQVRAVDPDTGTTDTSYDDLDRVLTTTNDRGITVWTGYDELSRVKEQRLNGDDGTLLTSFAYDGVAGALGQPSSSTRYTDGQAYKTTITGYDDEYRITGKSTTVPDTAATKGLAGTYAYSYTYTPTGKLQSTTSPAAGGLAQEKVITRYNSAGLPVSTSGDAWYTADTTYSPYGEVLRTVTGEQPYRVWNTNLYDENSGRLTTSVADREDTTTHRVNERYYTYDSAGNVTILIDVPDGDTAQRDRQCYDYDAEGRLTEAWTSANAGCKASGQTTRRPTYTDATGAVTATNVTSANDGYWQTYTYDSLGNRTKLVEHDADVTVGDGEVATADDVTTAYAYGTSSGTQPHTLTGITSDSASVDADADLTYDETGNTETRTYGGNTQTLTWTWDGKAESVSGFGAEGEGQVIGLAGKCMDLTAANTTPGTAVQLVSCNGKKAQRFQLESAGALKILGRCVAPGADGTAVTVAACTGAAGQKWTATASGALKHVSSGKCLAVPGADSTDGTDLALTTCDAASSAQSWSFADTTTYIYDASGNRLISSTEGAHTLYLDDTELSTDANGAVAYCQRYYTQAGAPTVLRHAQRGSSASSLTAIVTDEHGTPTATIALSSGQDVQRQKTDPFGVERGTGSATWLTHRGYAGGVDDNQTGLIHLGAREYDPETGRFISADPLLDIADPLSMNGYAYAADNPVTREDPSGLKDELAQGGSPTGTCPSTHNANCPEFGQGWDDDGGGTVGTSSSSTGQTVTVTVTQTVTVTKPAKDCNWWCKTKGFLQEHVEVVSFVTEIVVGVTCGAAVTAAGAVTGGAALAGVAGCGALAGMAGGMVGNALDPDADHSTGGYLKAEAKGGLIGAATSAVGFGVGKLAAKGASKLAKKLLSSCTHSFLPDTEVLLADGTTKPIEDVTTDDVILTTDTDTGKTVKRKVTATITTEDDKDFTKLTIATDDGGSSDLVATDHHPFWVADLDAWVEAADLQPGQWLRTSAGTYVQVTGVAHYREKQRTHDLTVEGVHAYYVLAGATPVLVHNCGGEATVHLDFSDPNAKHALITVRSDKGEVLSTHQFGSAQNPRAGVETFDAATLDPKTTLNVKIRLPNVDGAMAYSEVMMDKTAKGMYPAYSLRSQSCVTYCANVLRAGGVEGVPTTPSAAQRWFIEKLG
ncbi:RHS repeat-associated core domain containing protein-containing protein [Actinobacteria bacterium OK074]|nr:RHS repeat-associated core domain containing protein-containing protein [Actinobacteria bacterium OK074]